MINLTATANALLRRKPKQNALAMVELLFNSVSTLPECRCAEFFANRHRVSAFKIESLHLLISLEPRALRAFTNKQQHEHRVKCSRMLVSHFQFARALRRRRALAYTPSAVGSSRRAYADARHIRWCDRQTSVCTCVAAARLPHRRLAFCRGAALCVRSMAIGLRL